MKHILMIICGLLLLNTGKAQILQKPAVLPDKGNLPTPRINPVLTKLTKVAFEADITRERSSPGSHPTFDAIKYNDGNGFSLATNTFTAPTTGLYFFTVNFYWNGFGCSFINSASSSVTLMRNGREGLVSVNDAATNSNNGGFTSMLNYSTKLNAGDKISLFTVNLLCDAGGGSLPILIKGVFSGCLIAAD